VRGRGDNTGALGFPNWTVRFYFSVGALSLALFLAAGCNTTTVFLATFNDDTRGAPPSRGQATGTVDVMVGAGSVRAVPPPRDASSNWVEISHPAAPPPETGIVCNLTRVGGDGTYGLTALLYIPSGTGVSTVQFETADVHAPLFHLDFMPNNTIRIDDGSTCFGTFPRDRYFVVMVGLTLAPSSAVAHISLHGAGASGQFDYPLSANAVAVAHQFGAVRIWMGFQHTGQFDADDILVIYTP